MGMLKKAQEKTTQSRRELTPDELDAVNGGKPHTGQGIIDFFSWVACGFNYSVDFIMKADFYEVKCTDCGHTTWKRGTAPNIQGPKIKENP